jgi:transcriptional regulator with XRE-family HTH domain
VPRTTQARSRKRRDADAITIDTEEMLRVIGAKIRRERHERGLTLDTVAGRTGLTAAMVSMVELGRVAPSFGTLIAIASALDIHMSDLFDVPETAVREPVRRRADQLTFESAVGVLRRLVQVDDRRGLEFVVNEYRPGTSNAATAVHHAGFEYGLLLEGSLIVELAGEPYVMKPGDSISYASATPHRIVNEGPKTARAVWVKLDSDRAADGRQVRTEIAAVVG